MQPPTLQEVSLYHLLIRLVMNLAEVDFFVEKMSKRVYPQYPSSQQSRYPQPTNAAGQFPVSGGGYPSGPSLPGGPLMTPHAGTVGGVTTGVQQMGIGQQGESMSNQNPEDFNHLITDLFHLALAEISVSIQLA